MLPASNKGVGMNMGFPDPCLTVVGPALAPIPYPNMGMNVLAAPFSPNIFLTMMPALNMGSLIPMTMGDEPGAPNVIFKQMGGYTVGNPKVIMNGLPAANLTCPTYGNMHNDAVGAALVPSVTNVLLTWKTDRADHAMTLDDALALGDRLSSGAGVTSRLIGGAIGYVRIGVFGGDAPAVVHGRLRALDARGMETLVVDLRGCPGGDLEAALDLADEFLPDGAALGVTTDADGDATCVRAVRGHVWTMPLTILVDGGTASAAEVFAGILQHHRRARLVGAPTYGKGSMQHLVVNARGAVERRTTGAYLLPDETAIDAIGLDVDVRRSRDASRGSAR